MPAIVQEELWKQPGHPGMIIVTTNASITKDGRLLMGRGAARQAREKIFGIESACARKIRENCRQYGFMPVRMPFPEEKKVGFGIFQVKQNWSDPANPDLIKLSAHKLAWFAKQHPDWHFRMNFPGIGNGGLSREQVEPLLAVLPGNVTICYKAVSSNGHKPELLDSGSREVFLKVKQLLEVGQIQQAVEYLGGIGWQDPEGQVEAVRATLAEWDKPYERRKEQRRKRQYLSG
jgi:hypothetical protein